VLSACSFYSFCSVSMVLVNKSLASRYGIYWDWNTRRRWFFIITNTTFLFPSALYIQTHKQLQPFDWWRFEYIVGGHTGRGGGDTSRHV
jgi:hypothetical protein